MMSRMQTSFSWDSMLPKKLEEKQLDTLLITIQCNAIQCNENNSFIGAVPHGVVLYCSPVKDLNLAHYSITLKLW